MVSSPLQSWANSLNRANPENIPRISLHQSGRKLSLSKIFTISQKHLDSVEDVNQLTGMLFTNSDEVIDKLSAIHTIATGLTRIAKHAFEKHQNQATGLFGKIRWFIWQRFFDKRPQAARIQAKVQAILQSMQNVVADQKRALKPIDPVESKTHLQWLADTLQTIR